MRSVNYTKQMWDYETCESQNTTAGWYGFSNGLNIPKVAPAPGQCGTSSPIWFNGSYPNSFGAETTVTACLVSATSSCAYSWDVTVKNCGSHNIAYLEPIDYCGTYCMEVPKTGIGLDDPCYQYTVIDADYQRTKEYTIQSSDTDFCETNYTVAGWYGFSDKSSVLNSAPTPGQCGTLSPIWFDGNYPQYDYQMSQMTACVATPSSACEQNWPVTVKRCIGYHIAYLEPQITCGKYCTEQAGMASDPNASNSSPSPSGWTFNGTDDPCYYHFVTPSDSDRAPESILKPGETEMCDNITEGWYRYEYYEIVPTSPLQSGQCKSSRPIWFQGTYPYNNGEKDMKACMVGETSDCEDSWNVKVKNCYDMYNVAYLKPFSECGRICIGNNSYQYGNNPTSPLPSGPTYNGSSDPCYNHFVTPSDSDRAPESMLKPGETEMCDNITEGWYRYEYYDIVPTSPVQSGQCKSSRPIWFQGDFSSNNQEKSITACMAGPSSDCEDSWTVQVKNCYNLFNIAYLQPLSKCGRFCIDSNSTTGHTDYPDLPMPSDGYSQYPDKSMPPGGYTNDYKDKTMLPGGYTDDYNDKTMPLGDYTNDYKDKTMPPSGYTNDYKEKTMPPGGYTNDYKDNTMPPGGYTNDYKDKTIPPGGYTNDYKDKTMPPGGYTDDNMDKSMPPGGFTDGYNDKTMPPGGYTDNYKEKSVPPGVNTDYPHMSMPHSDSHDLHYMTTPSHPSNDPCFNNTVVLSEDDRLPSSTLDVGESEVCDDVIEGWYRFSDGQMVSTSAPAIGGCKSNAPIWFEGTTPSEGMETTMKACMVSSSSSCKQEWVVQIKNCRGYYIAYLPIIPMCARICMDDSRIAGSTEYPSPSMPPDGHTNYPDMSMPPGGNTGYLDMSMPPGGNTGYPDMSMPPGGNTGFPDMSMPPGGNTGYPDMSMPPGGSTGYPDMSMPPGGNTGYPDMSMPPGGNAGYSDMSMPPGGNTGYPDMSMPFSDDSHMTTPSSIDPCLNSTVIISESSRLSSSILNATENEVCDNTIEGWYRYSGGQKVPSSAPSIGGCTSNAPIWFDGTYPVDGTEATMKACMVGAASSCEHEWMVKVKSCPGFYTAYLQTLPQCGRFCMESGVPTLDELKKQYEIYVEPVVPSFTPNTEDNQLMFACKHREKQSNAISLDSFSLDIKWDIDGNEVALKEDIAVALKDTNGRLKSTEWISQPNKIGFNVKCSIKLHGTTDYMTSEEFFAGMQIYSNDLTVASGDAAAVYFKSTVPVACVYGTSHDCKLSVELADFTEEYTSGSPEYCSTTFTDLTKPSLCGLDLNGWSTGEWQKLDVTLPANVASDQEYRAKMKLRVVNSQYDALWSNYELPEVTINVVNQNVSNDYWWWNRDCFTGSDPWYFTFDWEWYGFHDEGEFALFKHKTKPIEVHTIQRRYASWHSWTEHCAVAIRAASDVFILYGCGRPTKWVQRRIGCTTGKEYLEVYERWGEYEVVLPTGTRVSIWIASNRMLNIYITLSKADRNNVEGLCGNANGIWSDDYTGKDGVLYTDDSLSFARTYRVPASDSLFIKSSRQTKVAESKLYCMCSGVSRTEQSSNEDCSWKETIPVCPPANWNKKSCTVRNKRSTDGSTDEKDDIDYSPVNVEHEDTTMIWKNGWNETAAKAACENYFSKSALYSGCAEVSNVNSSSSTELCVRNIRVSGGDEFLQDGLKMMTTKCTSEIRTNNTVYSKETSGGQSLGASISNMDCPNECKHGGVKKGECVNGKCTCHSGRAGQDCGGDTTIPPQLETEITTESKCNKCTKAEVYGSNVYSTAPWCKVHDAEVENGELVATGNETTVQGTLVGMGSVECPLTSGSRRKKRSTDSSGSVSYYLISISNDGTSYSESVPIISYDSSCYECTNTNSTVSCQLRSDVCVVNGECYSTSHSSCSSDNSSSSSKAWIAGVAVGLLFIIIIVVVILVYKFKVLKLKAKFKGSIAPDIPLEFEEKYEIWAEPGSLPPVDTTALYK